MKKYIDAEAFFKLINTTLPYGELDYPDKITYNAAISDMLGMLTHFPAADVAEVRHGRWVEADDDGTMDKCSVCGEYSCCRSPYCGECGAKMDEVERNEN